MRGISVETWASWIGVLLAAGVMTTAYAYTNFETKDLDRLVRIEGKIDELSKSK